MLSVRKSKIKGAGKGLFTTSRIRKGDVIVEYKGEKMPWRKCLKRYGDDIHQARYIFYISENNCVDAQNITEALARYANDAEGFKKKAGLDNNSEYQVIRGKAYIVATKPIHPGSEIFVDYQREYWETLNEMLGERRRKIHHENKLKRNKVRQR